MFGSNRKSAQPQPVVNGRAETVIGANTRFVGTLNAEGNVRIDGAVEGDIEVVGNLIIGETGRVIATIKARNVHVSGAVKGRLPRLNNWKSHPPVRFGAILPLRHFTLSRVVCSVVKAR